MSGEAGWFPSGRSALALLGAILLATVLRVIGIGWGLPGGAGLSYHPDEWSIANNAVRMVAEHDAHPQMFNYGSLPIYTAAAAIGPPPRPMFLRSARFSGKPWRAAACSKARQI